MQREVHIGLLAHGDDALDEPSVVLPKARRFALQLRGHRCVVPLRHVECAGECVPPRRGLVAGAAHATRPIHEIVAQHRDTDLWEMHILCTAAGDTQGFGITQSNSCSASLCDLPKPPHGTTNTDIGYATPCFQFILKLRDSTFVSAHSHQRNPERNHVCVCVCACVCVCVRPKIFEACVCMTGTGCVALADEEEAMARGAGLAAALAPFCTARPVRLAAGLWSENITEHTQVLDLK